MKKYLTKTYYEHIQIVEVERESEQSVWIKGTRNAKVTEYARYHDTFEEAKRHLIERHEKAIEYARDKIHRAESALGSIRKMTDADAKIAA